MASAEPLIFSMQHFCLHDGPGIRSLVFFKGCPLRCAWCQNVESWMAHAEIAFKSHLCIECGKCVRSCPGQCLTGPGKRDAIRCRGCHTCTKSCPSGAMTLLGEPVPVEKIVERLRPEFPLFRTSGGGVTLSGGEPTLYGDFAARLAKALHQEGIHVTLETCGCFDMEKTRPLIREVDLILFDIKVFDETLHRSFCGTGNRTIIRNLKILASPDNRETSPLLWPRFPLIPGFTADHDNIRSWARMLRDCHITCVTIVPCHQMGDNKRKWLGLPEGPRLCPPTDQELCTAEQIFAEEGITACSPGDEAWEALAPRQALLRKTGREAHT